MSKKITSVFAGNNSANTSFQRNSTNTYWGRNFTNTFSGRNSANISSGINFTNIFLERNSKNCPPSGKSSSNSKNGGKLPDADIVKNRKQLGSTGNKNTGRKRINRITVYGKTDKRRTLLRRKKKPNLKFLLKKSLMLSAQHLDCPKRLPFKAECDEVKLKTPEIYEAYWEKLFQLGSKLVYDNSLDLNIENVEVNEVSTKRMKIVSPNPLKYENRIFNVEEIFSSNKTIKFKKVGILDLQALENTYSDMINPMVTFREERINDILQVFKHNSNLGKTNGITKMIVALKDNISRKGWGTIKDLYIEFISSGEIHSGRIIEGVLTMASECYTKHNKWLNKRLDALKLGLLLLKMFHMIYRFHVKDRKDVIPLPKLRHEIINGQMPNSTKDIMPNTSAPTVRTRLASGDVNVMSFKNFHKPSESNKSVWPHLRNLKKKIILK